MSLDVSRLGIFSAIYHSHSKWHTFHNRKFLKHYKLRKIGKTISIHIPKEVTNACSLKLKVNQVSCIVIVGQKFYSWRISSRRIRLTLFLCSVSTQWKIRASLQQLAPTQWSWSTASCFVSHKTRLCFGSALGCCCLCNKQKEDAQFACGTVNIMVFS